MNRGFSVSAVGYDIGFHFNSPATGSEGDHQEAESENRRAGPRGRARSVGQPTSLAQSTPTLAAANATQTAPKPNPILVRLPEAFVILAQIFDPSESGPKAYSITSNGRSCTALKKRLRQFYGAGPFVETSPRIWGLDPHFGSPKLVVDPAFLKNLHFSW